MNGFHAGNRNPARQQGTIDDKVILAKDLIDMFIENARNPALANQVFPDGGDIKKAHSAMPGATVMLNRQYIMKNPTTNGCMQTGIVAFNGLHWQQYASQMEFESDWKWGGIAQTEQRLETSEYGLTDPSNQGFTVFVVGKLTIPWRSEKSVFSGDLVMVKCPRGNFHPEAPGGATFSPETPPHIAGNIPSAYTALYEPYIPTEFSVQVAGGAAALELTKGQNGIKDVPYEDIYPQASMDGVAQHKMSEEQEVAAALKFGLWGIALTLIQTLQNSGVSLNQTVDAIAGQIGLFDQANDIFKRGVMNVILNMSDPTDTARTTRVDNVSLYEIVNKGPSTNKTRHLRAHALQILLGGLAAAQEHKRSRVVGMAAGNANPGEDVPILFGYHTKG